MNLYAVPHGPELDEPEVKALLDDGWNYIYLARQLWSLVDEERAHELGRLMARLGGRDVDEVRLGPDDLDEALRLLGGLDDALVGPVIDSSHLLPGTGLDNLARRAPGLDLRPERPPGDRRHAVAEALVKVDLVRRFLQRARESNHDVVGG